MGPETNDANTPISITADKPSGVGAGISVVILTYNEEPNLAECLRSCAWCDDVHIVDSGSSDRTAEIAREMGAKVYVNAFESFGQQRNWAIDQVPHRHDWVFHLDADERFTPELVAEMRKVVAAGPAEAGFYVPHKLIFMGRWLRRAEGGYPVYQMRFFHAGRMRFEDWGHGQREHTTGRIGMLSRPYIHYNFSKGLEDWIDKHNRYSTLEAMELVAGENTGERKALGQPDRAEAVFQGARLAAAAGNVDAAIFLDVHRQRRVSRRRSRVSLLLAHERVRVVDETEGEGVADRPKSGRACAV